VGKRYTKEEIDQIKALVQEGFTNNEIATRLGRTEAGVRNIQHRMKFKAEIKLSLQTLKNERWKLNKTVSDLRIEISSLQAKKENITEVLNLEEQTLTLKLESTLQRLKDQKPELFYISGEEQIGKMIGELTGTFLKWLLYE
jgi:transposase